MRVGDVEDVKNFIEEMGVFMKKEKTILIYI